VCRISRLTEIQLGDMNDGRIQEPQLFTRIRTFILLQVIFCLPDIPLVAQGGGTAQISGSIRDSAGLAVPGAQIQIIQTDTGLTRTAQSTADGSYLIPSLPVGPYRLQVSKEGFSEYLQSGIVLQVDTSPTIDAVLKVGAVNERVEVTADAAMVETHSTGVGQVVDQRRVVELPLNGRQPQYLIFLAGAATTAPPGNLNSTKNYPTVVISVAGATAAALTYSLDGSTHNDPYSNQALPIPFPDALQEFKLETSALPAQYGQHSAAAVNAVTKSGSNALHGNAFEFLRNGDLNARDFFAASRDTLKRNQFGATLGGPVRRDRLFFFLGYQGTKQRSDPSNGIAFIPTPAMQAGDFTAFESPACNNGVQKNLNTPFVNNQIAPSLLDPAALRIMKYYPPPSDICGKEIYGSSANSDEHLGLARLDYQFSSKQSIFGRYYGAHLFNPSPYSTGGNPLALNNAGINAFDESLALGDTYLAGSNMVNSFHVTFNRAALDKFQNPAIGPTDVGIAAYSAEPHFMVLNAGTFTTGTVFAHAGNYDSTTMQIADDFSFQLGSHQLGFGTNWIHALNNNTIMLNAAGQYTFTGQFTGTALADFLTGQLATMTQGNPALLYDRQHYIGAYVQDVWKITSRLTLSYGLRWEPFLPNYLKQNRVSEFSYAGFLQNAHSTVYTNAPAGMIFAGDPEYPGTGVTSRKLANFMPRIGVVWDPGGNGRMTIRASFGRFYSTTHLFYDAQFAYQNPWGNLVAANLAGGVKLDNPWANYPGGNPFPLVLNASSVFPVNGTYTFYKPNTDPAYMQQWNLSVQRQFGANWLVSASYLGNNLIHGWTFQQINPGVYGPGATTGNITTRRVFYLQNATQGQYYGSVAFVDDGGTSTYDGGLFSVQRRLADNFTILGNYTWSHCITDLIPNDSGAVYVNPSKRRNDRGNCSGIDHRHIINISAVYATPKFSRRFASLLASGWQLSTIVGIQSGTYMSVTSGVDTAFTGIANQRPNQILASPYPQNQNVNAWVNALAFSPAAAGGYGNLGPNNIQVPGSLQIDMSLSRTFSIHERYKLQFRFEAFNVPNRLNAAAPNLTLNNPSFGKITTDISTSAGAQASGPGSGDPRVLQFALKYSF
jgi:hypothetical protein